MFEREIMVSTLKNNSSALSRLVEELESNHRFDVYDVKYCQETLRRIESSLKKIRKMQGTAPLSQGYGANFKF